MSFCRSWYIVPKLKEMIPEDALNIVIMLVVGGVAGTLAARIMRGTSFGLIVNVLLGVAGAIVGSFLFKLFGMTPGKNIVNIVSEQFNVNLPQDIIGQIVAGTIGAVIIVWLFGKLKGIRK